MFLRCKVFKPDATEFSHGKSEIVETQRIVFGIEPQHGGVKDLAFNLHLEVLANIVG
jgi:hypothetical protein